MAGNKTLQKFKDSKIPKKGKGKVNKEVDIYIEPNTQSVIIGKIPKDQIISWISKSVCDEREWIRCDEENNFGYIVGYEKDGSSNLDISSIKDKTNGKKKEKNFKIKPNEIVPITKEDINLGNEALNEILNGDDKNSDKDNESISNSTAIEENFISGLEDDKKKIHENKKKEENFDNWDFGLDEDISKIDFVVQEKNKLLNDLFKQIDEDENKSNNESKENTNEKKIDDNSISKAINSLYDVLPGNDKLSEKDKLLEALNLIPGGKDSKKEKSYQKDNIEEDVIRRSKTISLKGKNFPKEGGDYKK
jgi:hypothetical protein